MVDCWRAVGGVLEDGSEWVVVVLLGGLEGKE